MKKVKIFFAATGMLLITAAAVANKHSKPLSIAPFYLKGGSYFSVDANLSTTGSIQASIKDNAGNTYPLYDDVSGSNQVFLP